MTLNELPQGAFLKRVIDPCVIAAVLYIAVFLQGERFSGYYLALVIITFFVSSFVFEQVDNGRSWRRGNLVAHLRDTLLAWAVIVAVMLVIGHATGLSYQYAHRVVLWWFAGTPFALFACHLAARRITSGLRRDGAVRSAVIVGANEGGLKVAARIRAFPELLMQVHGYFEDRDLERHPPGMEAPLLGKMGDIAEYVRTHGIKLIFISLPMSAQPRISRLIDELKDTTASVYFLPDLYTFDLMQARFDNVGGVPVVAICETPFTGINSVVKRISDIVLAASIQLLASPLMLAIAVAVKLTSPGPVIFRQRRYGLNGDEIVVYKFRSMTVCEDGGSVTQATRNDQRVTRIGGFLRRSSLDELPQFINVLQGRMSIVGPRPHAVSHNEMYRKLIKGYMLRHKVKPGITGWAQVNGLRGETDTLDKMRERIDCDLDYLRNWSLWLDLWIIVRTVKVVLGRGNAY